MSSAVVSLYELINHCITCEDRLEPYKMNNKQIIQVFGWLDHRRRGHVDVSDFYAKFPQLSQSELFFVFKYLDVTRKGCIKLEDLSQLLCSKQDGFGESQNDSVKCFTSLIRVLKATFHLIEEQKKQLALTTTAVEQVFTLATFNKQQQIDLTDLIVVFKENRLEINQKMIIHLKTKIFTKGSLSMNQFVQTFSQFIWDWSPTSNATTTYTESKERNQVHNQYYMSYQNKAISGALNQEKLSPNIDSILSKYRNPQSVQSFLTMPKRQQYQPSLDLNKFMPGQPRSRFQTSMDEFRSNDFEHRLNSQDLDLYHTKYADISSNKIEQLLNSTSSINQGQKQVNLRREELRKGSIERQRIIDEVMNRKKYQMSGKPGMLYAQNLKIETNQEEVEPRLANTSSQAWRPSTPNSRPAYEYKKPNFESAWLTKQNQQPQTQPFPERQLPSRPASAAKTGSSFFDKSNYGKIFNTTIEHSSSKPDLQQYYRKGCQTPKGNYQEKQNIIRKAEEEASRKIQQIERRARLKVMEKRSATGIYNKWLK